MSRATRRATRQSTPVGPAVRSLSGSSGGSPRCTAFWPRHRGRPKGHQHREDLSRHASRKRISATSWRRRSRTRSYAIHRGGGERLRRSKIAGRSARARSTINSTNRRRRASASSAPESHKEHERRKVDRMKIKAQNQSNEIKRSNLRLEGWTEVYSLLKGSAERRTRCSPASSS